MTGRMINTDISESENFAKLSPYAAILFCLLIPHFNSHGKMKANAHLIKGLVCPKIDYLTVENIPDLLAEISEHTNVKYWVDVKGIEHIQSIKWKEEQNLRTDKLGKDTLPDWNPSYSCTSPVPLPDKSRTSPGLLQREEEGEDEEEGEEIVDLTKKGLRKTHFEKNPKFLPHSEWKLSDDLLRQWQDERPDLHIPAEIENCRRFIDARLELAKTVWDWDIFYKKWIDGSYYERTKRAKPKPKTKADKIMYADRVVYFDPAEPLFTASYCPIRQLEKISNNPLFLRVKDTGQELPVAFFKIRDA